jgi:hypothetical protein
MRIQQSFSSLFHRSNVELFESITGLIELRHAPEPEQSGSIIFSQLIKGTRSKPNESDFKVGYSNFTHNTINDSQTEGGICKRRFVGGLA